MGQRELFGLSQEIRLLDIMACVDSNDDRLDFIMGPLNFKAYNFVGLDVNLGCMERLDFLIKESLGLHKRFRLRKFFFFDRQDPKMYGGPDQKKIFFDREIRKCTYGPIKIFFVPIKKNFDRPKIFRSKF